MALDFKTAEMFFAPKTRYRWFKYGDSVTVDGVNQDLLKAIKPHRWWWPPDWVHAIRLKKFYTRLATQHYLLKQKQMEFGVSDWRMFTGSGS